MRRQFHKMHGLGNDFVIVDAREEPIAVDERLARAIADRHTGVGCDQLILLEPSPIADLKMRIWNHDGGEVQSCGNATRCVVALTGATRIETGGGIVEAHSGGTDVEVEMGQPRFGWAEIPISYSMDTSRLPMAWGELEDGMAINVGNPHIIFFVDDPAAIELDELGPRIEHDPAFPERVNVNVAATEDGKIRLRVWERGAGLTLACGTGACATAVAAILSKRVQSPVEVMMPGGSLTIAWAPGEAIRMRGPSTHVFAGELDLEAVS